MAGSDQRTPQLYDLTLAMQAKRETEILKRRNIAVEDDTISLINDSGQVYIL